MKKMSLALCLAIASLVASAQPGFGIQANGLLGTVKEKYTGTPSQESTSDSRFGWKAGLVADLPLAASVHFMPQLNVLSKGGKKSETINGVTYNGKLKLTYIEVPLLFTYNVSGLFIGVGPSASFGIGGKSKLEGGGQSIEEDVKFDGTKNATDNKVHYKAFEFGGHAIAGYKLPNGFFINAHYNLGLSNIDPEDNFETKTSYFGFGVGMMLGGMSK